MSRETAEQRCAASLEIFGAEPAASVTVVSQPLGRRIGRGLLALLIFLPLALAAVFVPLAHFVLVPGLLIAGIVVAGRRLREDRRLTRVQGREAGRSLPAPTHDRVPALPNSLTLVVPA